MTRMAIITLLLSSWALAQNEEWPDSAAPGFSLFPSGLQFAPLRADIQEARIGIFKFLNNSGMKVDVGNSIDLLRYSTSDRDVRFTVGIDFMAYAFTTGREGLRLQIDAIDGFFGGNISATKGRPGGDVQARLRILHHSAHLVDGAYSITSNGWVDNRQPIPFTQDFGELTLAHRVHSEIGTIRYYGGISYATLVRPADVQRLAYMAGIEIAKPIGSLLIQPANLYAVYHVSLTGTPAYAASHQIQIGMKFGEWYEKGPTIFLAYYSGRNMFGEYYFEQLSTIGMGFTVEFF